MKEVHIANNFKDRVIDPLGGSHVVDIYVNTEPKEFETVIELSKQFPIVSKKFESGFASLPMDKVCTGETMTYMDSTLSCWDPSRTANQLCGLLQHYRLDRCFRKIVEAELQRGKRYDVIVRARPDTYYKSNIISDKDLENALAYDTIQVPCVSSHWGICDHNAVIPRSKAQEYYSGVYGFARSCFYKKDWNRFAPDKSRFYMENLLAFFYQKSGYDLEEATQIQNKTSLPLIVRECGCDTTIPAVMHPNPVLSQNEICLGSISTHCSKK